MTEIDKEFAAVAQQINAKIDEATAALKEANRLREEANVPTLIYTEWLRDNLAQDNRSKGSPLDKDALNDLFFEIKEKLNLINVDALESEIGNAGWSTSSSYC